MNTTKFLTGTAVGTVVGFGVGFLVFGMALSGLMADNLSSKEPMDFLWLIIGHVFLAAFYTYIFMQWAGIKTAAGGAKAAAIITLLVALGSNFIWFATTGLFTGGIMYAVIDALAGTVVWAIGGAAIGWVLGKGGE